MKLQVFGFGLASKSPYVAANGLQNVYCETRPQGEKAVLVAYRTPGLTVFTDSGVMSPPRGIWTFDKTDSCFVVINNTFYQLSGSGTLTNKGALLTSVGRVSMSDNGNQVMIVDGTYGYIYNTTTGVFAQITDVDFPVAPQTVSFLSGYFIVNLNQSSRFYVSARDDGLTWAALDFANAETNPDPIISTWTSNGQLVLMGSRSMEFWGNSGAVDFPFTQIVGTATEWGLAARWSVAKYDNSFACLVKNRMGQVMVAQIAGYLPKKISTPDLDAIINGYSRVDDASAYGYMLGGHAMYVINFPTAGASWLFDSSTNIWTQLKGYGLTRHRAEFGTSFLTNSLVCDYASGIIYKLDSTALNDAGQPMESQITSETVIAPDLQRFTVNKFRIDMEVGDGNASYPNPQVSLQVSRDNGRTWGAEMFSPLGPLGNYSRRVEWTRLGTAANFVFRLRVVDAVPFVLVNALLNPPD